MPVVPRPHIRVLLVVLLLLTAVVAVMSAAAPNRVRITRSSSNALDECLILEAELGGDIVFFQIDTGYAGPPVLSASYLAVHAGQLLEPTVGAGVRARYQATLRALRTLVSDEQRAVAVDAFLARASCRAFTSGCTMRLMGISNTVEQQADMMLCAPVSFRAASGWMRRLVKPTTQADAEVFVTNPLHASCHILTTDFLRQASPVLLRMRGDMELYIPTARAALYAATFHTVPLRLVAGAPIVTIDVGGVQFVCTVDTGSPGPISLGTQAAGKLPRNICRQTPFVSHQSGVNGDTVCSSIIVAPITIAGGPSFASVPIFVNSAPVEGTDGYVGMGLLRAFDLLFTDKAFGIRASGISPRAIEEYSSVPGECIDTGCIAQGP